MNPRGKAAPKREISGQEQNLARQEHAAKERHRFIRKLPPKVAALILSGIIATSGCAPSSPGPAQVPPSQPKANSVEVSTSFQSSTAQAEFDSRMADARAQLNNDIAYIQEHFVSTIGTKLGALDPSFSFAPYEKLFKDQLDLLLVPSNIILVYEPTSPYAGSVSESGVITLNIAKQSLSTKIHEALDAISKNCPSRALAEAGSELLTQLFLSRNPQLLNENPFASYPPQTGALFFLLDAGIVKPDAFLKAYVDGNAAEFYAQINAFSPGLGPKLFPPNSSLSDFLTGSNIQNSQALGELFNVARSKGIDVDGIIAGAGLLRIEMNIDWPGR